MAKVSVILPSYNHERYIGEAVQSALDQTLQDIEIIIIDDSSRDRSLEILKKFADPRVKLFVHEQNRGLSITANDCIRRAEGQYIAMLNSDDVWEQDKLELQVDYLDSHPDAAAVFGKVTWIDDAGVPITQDSFPYLHVFDVENRTRFEWLHRFMVAGNCLCHPSSVVRRECYSEVGFYDITLANLQDFDLWVRICLKSNIHVLEQKLVRFRRISEEANLSGDNPRNRNRGRFEYRQVLNHYLKLKDPQELLLVFPEAGQYGNITSELIPFFVARTAIEVGTEFRQLWGMEVLYSMLSDEENACRLEEQCSFTPLDLMRLAGELDVFQLELGQLYAKQQVEMADLRSQANDLRTQANNLRMQANDLRATLDGMSQSISWKLTRPLRATKAAVRKML